MSRWVRGLAALGSIAITATLVGMLAPTTESNAVTTTGWASWQPLIGESGSWTSSMQLPAKGFPVATITSDSLAGQVGVQSGANSWLSQATPPGAVYGSSRDQPYLLLKPRANNPTSPSITTYTFAQATPAAGWAFVLGDIDADRAVVTALGTDGQPVAGTDLGWQGGFNYCAVSPSPSCTGSATDIATWDPNTGEVIGNVTGNDTSGASGWFQPTVPLTSLTIAFYQRTGFPSYQTWFASLARDISGSVTLLDSAGNPTATAIPGATLALFDATGTALATTVSAADGSYAFLGYATTSGYRVELTQLPISGAGFENGLVPFNATPTLDADLTTADATHLDFAAQAKALVSVSGTVRASDGTSVAGAQVTLTSPDGTVVATVSTGTDGSYTFATVLPGDYTVAILPPPEYLIAGPAEHSVSVADQALTGMDFTLFKAGVIIGTVTNESGLPAPNIELTIEGPGQPTTVTTNQQGEYHIPKLPPGDYRVNIRVPEGFVVENPSQPITLTDTGERIGDPNFVLKPMVKMLPRTGVDTPASLAVPLASALVVFGLFALAIPRRLSQK